MANRFRERQAELEPSRGFEISKKSIYRRMGISKTAASNCQTIKQATIMTIEEQIATELIERTKWNESSHYAGRIEGDGWWFSITAVFYQDSFIPVWWECSDDTVEIEEIRRIFQSKLQAH